MEFLPQIIISSVLLAIVTIVAVRAFPNPKPAERCFGSLPSSTQTTEPGDIGTAGLSDRQMQVVQVSTPSTKGRNGNLLSTSLFMGLSSDLSLLAIERDGEYIDPAATAKQKRCIRQKMSEFADDLDIREGDELDFIGTQEQAEAYMQNLEATGMESRLAVKKVSLGDFMAEGHSDWALGSPANKRLASSI